MGVNIKDGKVSISAVYGVTVGKANYSSEKLSQSLLIEFDYDGDSSAAIAAAEGIYSGLEIAVKTAVIKGLGLDADFNDEGVLTPKLEAAAPQASAPKSGGYNGGGGGGSYKPKYNLDTLPKFTADLGEGSGNVEWYDLRPQRTNDNAPSFRAVSAKGTDGKAAQVWLKDKSGAIKASVAGGLAVAGVSVE